LQEAVFDVSLIGLFLQLLAFVCITCHMTNSTYVTWLIHICEYETSYIGLFLIYMSLFMSPFL